MSASPTIVEALEGLIEARLRDVRVAVPAQVVSYDRTIQAASVQPLIQDGYTKEDGTRGVETMPQIPRVPVMFPGDRYDLVKGDTVLLIISHASLDKWKSKGGVTDPLTDRHHDMSDAMAIPGLNDFKNPSPQVASGARITEGDDIRLGSKDASDPVALKSDIDRLLAVIQNWTPVGLDGGLALKTAMTLEYGPIYLADGATKVKAE